MYIDELFTSLDTMEQAETVYRESTELFADSGFKLTKWSANAEEILQIIPQDVRAPSSRIITNGSPLTCPWYHGFPEGPLYRLPISCHQEPAGPDEYPQRDAQ